MRAFLLSLVVAALLVLGSFLPASGDYLKGQAVTYTNFDFIHAVASSMSHVYFATDRGIIRFNKMETRWEEPLTGADGLGNDVAKRIWVDRFDEKLYVQTDVGYYEYDLLFGRWYPINSLPPIDTDSRHTVNPDVLLPTFDANYLGEGRFVDIHSRSYAISDVVDDGSGTLWIATWGFGPATADKASKLMELLPYGLLQTRVNAILPDDTVTWVSGAITHDFRTGLTAFNHNENRFFHVESGLHSSFPAVDVNCLAADDERLYVGTPLGIYLVERGSWSVSGPVNQRRGLPDNNVLSLQVVDSMLFAGTAAGLSMISLVTDSIYHVRPTTFFDEMIFDLEPVGASIWIASSVGAFRFSLESRRLQQYQDPEMILFSRVYDIESYDNYLWFAGDNGLVRLDTTTGKSTSYRDIIPPTDSRALAVNGKIAATASLKGMKIFFLDRDESFNREFTTDDGLAGGTVYSLLLDGDYVWVGTEQGLTRFLWNNPDRVD